MSCEEVDLNQIEFSAETDSDDEGVDLTQEQLEDFTKQHFQGLTDFNAYYDEEAADDEVIYLESRRLGLESFVEEQDETPAEVSNTSFMLPEPESAQVSVVDEAIEKPSAKKRARKTKKDLEIEQNHDIRKFCKRQDNAAIKTTKRQSISEKQEPLAVMLLPTSAGRTQQTLTQLARDGDEDAGGLCPPQNGPMKLPHDDLERRVYLAKGRILRVFERFATWTVKRKVGPVYFSCENGFEIDSRGIKNTINPKVYVALENTTFIGKKEAEELGRSENWQSFNGKNYDKLLVANNSNYTETKGRFPLNLFDKLVSNEPLSCNLMWDEGLKPEKGSTNFNQAYRYKNSDYREVESTKNRELVALDLFAGGGGMGLGFARAGFRVISVENDKTACATLIMNCHGKADKADIFNEDVRTFFERCNNRQVWKNHPDLLSSQISLHIHASSPCQGFSSANIYGGKNDAVNNELSLEFLDYIEAFLPRTVSFENVTGMYTNGRLYLQKIIVRLLELKYQVRIRTVSAEPYDAQSRNRIFIFGANHQCKLPDLPTPPNKKRLTVEDVLRDFVNILPAESGVVILDNAVEGVKYVSGHTVDGTTISDESRKSNKPPVKLINRRPAPTVRKTNPLEHPDYERGLTIRERARLQSFPDDVSNHHSCDPIRTSLCHHFLLPRSSVSHDYFL